MHRRFAALAVALFGVVPLVLATGCSDDGWVQADPSPGWSAQYGDAANSSYVAAQGPSELTFDWTRSVKGELGAAVALNGDSDLAANAQTTAGCSLMTWESDNDGRQRWCIRLVQGGGFAGPMFDGFSNLYVGQPGTILSYPLTQWVRWRKQVIGMPQTPRLLGDGQLLVATHLGQVQVFDAHRGTLSGNPVDLVSGLDPTDSERGLDDCAASGPECPVASAPAFSPVSQMIVLGLRQPGAPAATLVGLRYQPGQKPLLAPAWTSDAVTDGVIGAPVLSADGATVYVNGRDQQLWALDASTGEAKWSAPLGFLAQTPPTVSPDGLIISGGGPGAALVAFRDEGQSPDEVWREEDVEPLSTTSRSGDTGYTVVRDGQGLALLVFDATSGETRNRYPLPEATGFPVGVSIGVDQRVVTATSDGQVYGFSGS
ncbi:pyrrolo-quinoline quinone [Mycobacterium sp. MS1601]|uniref:outer membrane protein assembly factor BamB family protein n=1 Tax=Mycobacterium sp. MS1601 TaxID=1936029 RepID=UPI0009796980|nr:pyrrolo-quinoline quinone [Mycobacterium sp. MS1601]